MRCWITTLVLGLTLSAAQAQATYDDFRGAAIDGNRWFQFGNTTLVSQSGGLLRLNGPSDVEGHGVYSTAIFQGDFELILTFQGFQSNTTAGEPALVLAAFDALAQNRAGSELRIGLVATSQGRAFVGELEDRGNSAGTASLPTTAVAGSMRLVRRGTQLSVSFRTPGQSAWTTLRTWPDRYVTPYVRFVIEADTGDRGSVTAQCSAVQYVGTRLAGPVQYGSRCHQLGATSLGRPSLGNTAFSLFALGPARFSGSPALVLIGSGRTQTDLGPFGAAGCTLLTQPVATVAAPPINSDGETEFLLNVPNNPFLIGRSINLQFVAVQRVNALGVAFSNGTEVTFMR